MKILVIDDSSIHQESARQTIVEHDLTVVGTYDEAHRLINGVRDGFTHIPGQKFDVVLSDLLMPASRMTMGEEGLKYAGQETAVGFALALMAALGGAKYVGVATATNHHDHPVAAMIDAITSRCAHKHDSLGIPPRFVINGARVGFFHAPMIGVIGAVCPACEGKKQDKYECKVGHKAYNCNYCGGRGYTDRCYHCSNGLMWGKDWGRILACLLGS